ncbi:MAG: type VII toxin-antitoxin system MntA family adenylyltransferase antitoxin [Thermodesulfovibrionales bacterium]
MGVKERWGKSGTIKFTTEEAISLVSPLLNNNPDILVAYLFGSRIKKGDQSSDIDIAFYTSDDFSWEEYYLLYGEISKALCSDRIDIIWLNKSDPIFKFEVIKNGKVLFYKDADILNDFELKSKKNYYDYVHYIYKHRRNRGIGL